jgi:beta-hydroxylase
MNPIYFWEDYIKDVPLYKDLIQNYPQIKEEVLNYLKYKNSLFDYPKYIIYGKSLYDNYWKACPISNFEGELISNSASEIEKLYINKIIKNAKQHCPTINSIISNLEEQLNLKNAFISRLIPGSIINPHHGWTNDFLRIHLGLVCDPDCKITVGNETKTWEEGKILAFKDGGPFLHSVEHKGTSERIILSVDVKLSYLRQYVEYIE